MKDTMTKKEFSAYTEELMGDILFRLKDNGGSMLKDTMDNIIEDIYGRKFKNTKGVDIQRCWGAYLSWTDDTYDEMYRRGWMTRTGNTLHLTDKGRRADKKSVKVQRVVDVDHNQMEEILSNEAKKAGRESNIKKAAAIGIVGLLLLLSVLGWLPIKDLIEHILNILF